MALELPEHQQPVFQRQVQATGGLLHDPAEDLRTDRQLLGFEGRPAGHDPEALAQQVQRQAGAHLGATGDRVELGRLLLLVLSQQLQLGAAGSADRTGGVLAAAQVQVGQGRLQSDHEARREVGTAALHRPQGLEAGLLHLVAAGLLGELEQLLLDVVERRGQAPLELVAGVLEHALEQAANARWKRTR